MPDSPDPFDPPVVRQAIPEQPPSVEPRHATTGLAVGATVITASQAIVAVFGALTGIIVARLLGPAGTGAFSLMLSTVLLIGVFASLGIEIGISYHVGGRRWQAQDALRQSQLAAAILGAAGMATAAGFYVVTDGEAFDGIDGGALMLGLAGVPFLLSWRYVTFLAIALERYRAYAVATVTQGVAMLAIVAALTPFLGLDGALIGLSMSQLITAVGLIVWGRRRLSASSPGWLARSRRELGRASSFGIKAYLTNAMAFLNHRADLYVLSASATAAAVGEYAVALTVTSLGLLLPSGLSSVLLPRVAALEADAVSGRSELIASSIRHSVVIVLVSTAAMAAGVLAIPLLYGPGFEGTVALGYMLLPGVAALGVGTVLGAAVTGKGRPEYSLYAAALVTPPTLALYAVVIPVLEAPGAAIVSTASYVASSALTLVYFRRVAPEIPLRALLPGRREARDYRFLVKGLVASRRG